MPPPSSTPFSSSSLSAQPPSNKRVHENEEDPFDTLEKDIQDLRITWQDRVRDTGHARKVAEEAQRAADVARAAENAAKASEQAAEDALRSAEQRQLSLLKEERRKK